MVSQTCYTPPHHGHHTHDQRRYSSRAGPPYFCHGGPYSTEQRRSYSSSEHHSAHPHHGHHSQGRIGSASAALGVSMSDQGSSSAMDSESQPQRKRIAVACGRCRKRKIRCSGDPGQGQPCTNCKNAGVDQCLFLRVSSRDIPLKPDTSSDFGYSVDDARLYANRNTMSPASIHYGQHAGAVGVSGLASTAEDSLMAQYGRGYAYGHHQAPPPTSHKQYFPATASYASYGGDPTAVGVSGQFGDYTAAGYPPVHAMAHETVGIVPSWGSGARKTPYGGVYMESTPESYGGYGSSSLVHRPAHHGAHHGHGTSTTESQSPNFSFSGVAASLPTTSTGADRLLPNPTTAGTSRSSLPYPGTTVKTGVSSSLADVAASATAYGGFDDLPASYGSASTASAGHSSSVRSHSTSADTYHSSVSGASGAGAGESPSIFGEEGRSLQSQGTAFDMNTYTAEPVPSVSSTGNRRDSVGSSATGGGHGALPNGLSNGQAYVPSESVVQVGPDHHAGHQHQGVTVYEQQRHQALADGHRASLASHR
ncbi:hypothetical protein QBC32DRAFT_263985 [Pseudoneurospora amorphoporcata]|uniref:Zn(2)-C6 fungal-type domain-containing protein n=1 Tax=Pseudoneurospora amorphoporcata TaxID=241081 RepID=A0AAN6NRT9_9PEZI|nr:hypothetical protein QBC32DRAFT_263985 [Pseudoneurospora amorphoporcata]